MEFREIDYSMVQAIEEAKNAAYKDEVPVGAIITSPTAGVLASTHNLKENTNNPCGHAEILAIQEASKKIKEWRLLDCSIFVTLEPCPMCLAALLQARIKNVYFGAYDKKGGALSLGYNFHKDQRLNHSFEVYGGYRHFECSQIISNYFRSKRKNHNLNRS